MFGRDVLVGGLLVAWSAAQTVSAQSMNAGPLSAYAWKQRLLLVAAEHEGRAEVRAMVEALSGAECGLRDRDLVIGWLFRDGASRVGAEPLQPEQVNRLYGQLGIDGLGFAVVLIGKDGGVKARYTDVPDLAEIFVVIDGMPMRRAELRAAADAACPGSPERPSGSGQGALGQAHDAASGNPESRGPE